MWTSLKVRIQTLQKKKMIQTVKRVVENPCHVHQRRVVHVHAQFPVVTVEAQLEEVAVDLPVDISLAVLQPELKQVVHH